MLGKLIKYEWKSVYKVGCLILGAVALTTFMGWLAFQSPMWKEMETGHSYSGAVAGWLNIISGLTLIMYVILLACASFGTLVYLVVHFYRTMYTDEGYLIHTLPVTKHQILVSKILVGGIWMLFVGVSLILSAVFLCMTMLTSIFGHDMAMFWKEFVPVMDELIYMMRADFDVELGVRFALGCIKLLAAPFITLTILFGAVSLGQLAGRHRVLMAIISYIGISIAMNFVGSVIRGVFAVALYGNIGQYMWVSMDIGFLVDLVAAGVLYFVSWNVISKKLNMV